MGSDPYRHTLVAAGRRRVGDVDGERAGFGEIDLLRRCSVIGDPDDCVRELRRYVDELGVNTFIFRVQWPGMEQAKVLRTIRLLAERVMPAFR